MKHLIRVNKKKATANSVACTGLFYVGYTTHGTNRVTYYPKDKAMFTCLNIPLKTVHLSSNTLYPCNLSVRFPKTWLLFAVKH